MYLYRDDISQPSLGVTQEPKYDLSATELRNFYYTIYSSNDSRSRFMIKVPPYGGKFLKVGHVQSQYVHVSKVAIHPPTLPFGPMFGLRVSVKSNLLVLVPTGY